MFLLLLLIQRYLYIRIHFFFTQVRNIFWGWFFSKKTSSHGFIFISRKGSVNFFYGYCLPSSFFTKKKKKCSHMDDQFPKEKLPVLSMGIGYVCIRLCIYDDKNKILVGIGFANT